MSLPFSEMILFLTFPPRRGGFLFFAKGVPPSLRCIFHPQAAFPRCPADTVFYPQTVFFLRSPDAVFYPQAAFPRRPADTVFY